MTAENVYYEFWLAPNIDEDCSNRGRRSLTKRNNQGDVLHARRLSGRVCGVSNVSADRNTYLFFSKNVTSSSAGIGLA